MVSPRKIFRSTSNGYSAGQRKLFYYPRSYHCRAMARMWTILRDGPLRPEYSRFSIYAPSAYRKCSGPVFSVLSLSWKNCCTKTKEFMYCGRVEWGKGRNIEPGRKDLRR